MYGMKRLFRRPGKVRRATIETLESRRKSLGDWEGTLDLMRRLADLPDETPVEGDDERVRVVRVVAGRQREDVFALGAGHVNHCPSRRGRGRR